MTPGRAGVLLMAYGTPRTPEAIEPYYTDIRRGRPPTPEQLADLVRRYEAIGGLSPLAERTEDQRAGLQASLDARVPGRFEVVLGFKHARPTIEDALAELAERDMERAVALVLAPHYSALSVGQYLDRAEAAGATTGLTVLGIRSWHHEPAYLDFLADAVGSELARMPARTKVLFTAHSLPERILTTGDPYPDELRATAAAVADRVGLAPETGWSVAWQSAGRTPEPWLGPDVLQVITELARPAPPSGRRGSEDAAGVLVCACGFVADHLEVLYDLDIEARRQAEDRGLAFARTACVNADPAVLGALADRVVALAAGG